jgi:hypothetical protein
VNRQQFGQGLVWRIFDEKLTAQHWWAKDVGLQMQFLGISVAHISNATVETTAILIYAVGQ